jgi:acetyl-CoA acyltransferase
MNNTYIVSSVRTAVGKAKRGSLAQISPVEMGVAALTGAVEKVNNLDIKQVEDILVGCANPEAEQGMNMAMIIGQSAGLGNAITGATINRFCASGLQTIAMAHQAISFGQSDIVAAGGSESMSLLALGGNHFVAHPQIMDSFPDAYMNMGNTAEYVADKYKVSRTAMDEFALNSHAKALNAISKGYFENEIAAMQLEINKFDGQKLVTLKKDFKVDEGPRAGSTIEAMAKLRSPFRAGGNITAANSSQMSDGAAMSILMSEAKVNELGVQPIAKLLGFATAPVDAKFMGMGPVAAVPKVLKQVGLDLKDIGLIELNEAFASQSIAVINELGLDPNIVNVNGGALALGHPLGCTGAKLTATLLHEMQRRGIRYGLCTMCVGGGMGAAGIFENLML